MRTGRAFLSRVSGATPLRWLAGRLVLLLAFALFAAPAAQVQLASAAERPVADSQFATVDGVVTHQRPMARGPLASDPSDDLSFADAPSQGHATRPAMVVRSHSPHVLFTANFHILPPLRGPPVA